MEKIQKIRRIVIMNEETVNETKSDYEEIMNMKLGDVLANIAYSLDKDGATEGDVGRLVFGNKYYGFSVTVVKKED